MPVHSKKRSNEGRVQRPSKKQKRKQEYKSDSEEGEFDAVNLLDSDDDIHNVQVDDAADSEEQSSSSEDEAPAPEEKATLKAKEAQKPAPEDESDEGSSVGDEDSDADTDDDEGSFKPARQHAKSKKRDNTAFATSLSKILATKLSSSKRADPVLSRSTEAQEASRDIMDTTLDAKARRQLREQKRRASEKGRVKDVLVATRDEKTGEFEASTAEIMETERRLRKLAQRGVVKLFNAVRAAQVAATDAEKGTRKAGVIGMNRREEKVNELTKKGFLDLIASGGGGLKKTALEEA
ncbi:pre-60S ribosomal particles component [Amphichorda felina]